MRTGSRVAPAQIPVVRGRESPTSHQRPPEAVHGVSGPFRDRSRPGASLRQFAQRGAVAADDVLRSFELSGDVGLRWADAEAPVGRFRDTDGVTFFSLEKGERLFGQYKADRIANPSQL